MNPYRLIDIDQMETSKLRRSLDPWHPAKAERIKALISDVLSRDGSKWIMKEPKWEISVYPLYYFFVRGNHERGRAVYNRILAECKRLFPEPTLLSKDDLYKHLQSSADAEIDLLIEDLDYFIFVEAKNPPAGKKAKFGIANGVHQLVRQYLQGEILERVIGKKFLMATVGADFSGPLKLKDLEKCLLAAVGSQRDDLYVHDFPWNVFDRKG